MAERNENGKFAKGNSGGPGRPKKEREARFYEITLTTVTFEDWRDIVDKAISQAKRGDAVARKWLADYLMGPPVSRTELTGKDGGKIEQEVTLKDESIIRKLLPEIIAGGAQGAAGETE